MTFDVSRVGGLRWALLAGALLAMAPSGLTAQAQAILARAT
jgi:hypothetical protein